MNLAWIRLGPCQPNLAARAENPAGLWQQETWLRSACSWPGRDAEKSRGDGGRGNTQANVGGNSLLHPKIAVATKIQPVLSEGPQ